jgi:hypothetical protein
MLRLENYNNSNIREKDLEFVGVSKEFLEKYNKFSV